MDKKEFLDIDDVQAEFDLFQENLKRLQNRFMAVAMDYKYYIDSSWGEHEIFELRDNVQYRLFSAKLHVQLLLQHHYLANDRLSQLYREDPKKITGEVYPANPYFEHYAKEVSSIFDSTLYHIASVYDYLSTLTNYICGNKKHDPLSWNQLKRSCNDPKNPYSKTKIAQIILLLDKKFVGKLYDHRSFLIHKKADLTAYSVTVIFGKETSVIAKFVAGKNVIKKFSELRKLSSDKMVTVKYVVFWILNNAIHSITKMLFGLKHEMESNPQETKPIMGLLDKEINTLKPMSHGYWLEEEFRKHGT